MATNIGTKIAMNAHKCISMRDNENVITYNREFSCRPIQRRHFWLRGSKGRCHGNQILAEIGKNITKMAITSVVCNMSICDTPVHNEQRGVIMATNFGTKVAINAYKCISTTDNGTEITFDRESSWLANVQKTFLIANF